MKKVHNLVILDASGSMDIIRKSAHSGLNTTIKQLKSIQKEMPDRQQLFTLVIFNSAQNEFLYSNSPIDEVGLLPYSAYRPEGCTPLYDAIGLGIHRINKVCQSQDTVLVTIITDGEENSSKEFTHAAVKQLIAKCRQKGWDFTFIGTEGIDVKGISHSIGITHNIVFQQSEKGTSKMFEQRNIEISDFNKRLSKG